jgi:zinc/manganese transport system substrate-binding protein
MSRLTRLLAPLAAALLLASACGSDDPAATSTGTDEGAGAVEAPDEELPTVVVTTTTLADVVRQLVGDGAEVVSVMPVGADPHDFQASAQQVAQMREADALVVNGAGFEEGLLDVIESAEADGVPTYEAISEVDTIGFGASDEEEGEDEHGHEGADPHFFQDPARMAVAAAGIGRFLTENVDGIDAQAVGASTDAYVDELLALDADVEALLADIPDERRVLVTNHDAFGYFADRYGFEVVGTVIPSGSTSDGAGAADLAELAEAVRDEQVPAIFTENVASSDLAQALASEVGGDVEIVELYTDSLGEDAAEAGSYVDMVRTNAERIAAALA